MALSQGLYPLEIQLSRESCAAISFNIAAAPDRCINDCLKTISLADVARMQTKHPECEPLASQYQSRVTINYVYMLMVPYQ